MNKLSDATRERYLNAMTNEHGRDICPECDGHGTLWGAFNQTYTCGECGGEGIVARPEESEDDV